MIGFEPLKDGIFKSIADKSSQCLACIAVSPEAFTDAVFNLCRETVVPDLAECYLTYIFAARFFDYRPAVMRLRTLRVLIEQSCDLRDVRLDRFAVFCLNIRIGSPVPEHIISI